MNREELEDLKTVSCCPDHDKICTKAYYYILELEGKVNHANDKIKTCLEFIDDLLPKYLEEKSHIIMGDDWELNRSIYVMSELRDRLMGFIKDECVDVDDDYEPEYNSDDIKSIGDLQDKVFSRIKELEAEVKEANDNATWWHNRFNAAERKIERLENDYYFALDKLVGGAKMIKRQQKCLMDEYLVLKDKREKRINDHIKKLEGKDAA